MEEFGFHTATGDQDNLKPPVLRVCDVPGHEEGAGRMRRHSLICFKTPIFTSHLNSFSMVKVQ